MRSVFLDGKFTKGDLVFDSGKVAQGLQVVCSFEKSPNKEPVGVSLYTTVEMGDPIMKRYLVPSGHLTFVGNKAEIACQDFDTVLNLPVEWQLPRGQKLYVGPKGEITFRYGSREVGYLREGQDQKGECFARITLR